MAHEVREREGTAQVGDGPIQLHRAPGEIELRPEDRDDLLQLYRLMLLVRRFEERAKVEYTHAKIGGYCHLNLGEEATVAGGLAPLRTTDYLYTGYREHGHAIARGVPPRAVMSELFGRVDGTSHGRGGSMHMFDYERRFMGGYGIVGGHLPLATGAGFAIKYAQEVLGQAPPEDGQDIVFCMFGDGATNIGAFHESLNLAKVMEVPVVWFCVNNQYGMGTPVDRASAEPEIFKRACAYRMESVRVDGMDVLQVLHQTAETIAKTRADSQPRLIEAVAYRFLGHSVIDPDKYRSEEEKARWRESDPVISFEHRLEKARIASREELERLDDDILAEIDEVV
ncbi:MAG: thiamine pyrophosphate-dependent enzyme, partial [Candidatus Dormibacteraceae bacterium]